MSEAHRHGRAPWSVVAVHGGPGACGELAPLAARLDRRFGVLEPWCTAPSVDGQIAEIAAAVAETDRAVLIGHSLGVWTTTLFAARHPERVAGLIWIGAPPFDGAAAEAILPTRLACLDAVDRAEVAALAARLSADPDGGDPTVLGRLGRLFARTDAWDPAAAEDDGTVAFRVDVFRAVWPEGAALRATGALRRALSRLAHPVVAFHGDHDPHPIEAIAGLAEAIPGGLTLHRLDRCGHSPWREPAVRDRFLAALEREIARLAAGAGTTTDSTAAGG
ncbi:MAG: alpha/beta hydrolase [Phyllobacteriaceae bacterium]|nr:alpha/beta hydrolase [Phyllobacteriaceae bacterium]